jgi:hypothetical protein
MQSVLDRSNRKGGAASTSAAGVTTQATKRKFTQQSLASLIGSANIQFRYSAASGRHTQREGITGEAVLRNFNSTQKKAAKPQRMPGYETCISALQYEILEMGDDISEGKE